MVQNAVSAVKYILFAMKWKVSFSGIVCENTCHYRSSAAEKNKMPNLVWKAMNIGAKSRNCIEISFDWRITQCMKHWMHAWISFLVIFYMPVQDFKTKEPLSKKKFSFLFLLKSWENADICLQGRKTSTHQHFVPKTSILFRLSLILSIDPAFPFYLSCL